jgi:hypothetical protein
MRLIEAVDVSREKKCALLALDRQAAGTDSFGYGLRLVNALLGS